MKEIVGLGEMKVSNKPDDLLITYSLGSCIGLSLYDPIQRVGGLIHCMVPLSSTSPEKAASQPCMFTDTGVVVLLKEMFSLGAARSHLVANVAGGAVINEGMGKYNIGKRNYVILKKLLWKNDILISNEAVGGSVVRTMQLQMSTGKTHIKTTFGIKEL